MDIFTAVLVGFVVGVVMMACALFCSGVIPLDDNNNNNNVEQPQPNVARITIVRPMPPEAAVQVKVEKIIYDECTDEGSIDGGCSICLEKYRGKELSATIDACSHHFHAQCIESWLEKNDNCPLCRHHLV
ncbi:RING-H2 finger protein ATL78-like [Salvia hispanica]|uniref:RING-H2 finger protein ATL78-like n=1 Tax=Salvia hispanica TaxID=49212 RepID=UPI002008F6EA|nr:RING-H2 finger protein ATL78-like [Salvia hispanica]